MVLLTMYSREIQEDRPEPVENGIPLQGTWTQAFEKVDLLSIHRPYSFPLPNGLKDLRIKEWESFTIQNERFYILARLCNFKFYHTAIVFFYDKETEERQVFSKLVPGYSWKMPGNLYNSSVESRSLGFFVRIHSWLDTKKIILELDIKKRGLRPSFTAHASFNLSESDTTPVALSLLFADRRNMYAFKALSAVSADIFSGGRHFHLDSSETTGLFSDFKGYFPYRMRSTWGTGMGFDSSNRRFGFSLAENQARDQFLNNENALWIDGALSPLPPVKITRSNGPESDWIIQDMEGMVDLVFTPKDLRRDIRTFIFSRSEYDNPLGFFNGKLLNAEGEELPIKNVWGAVENLILRV